MFDHKQMIRMAKQRLKEKTASHPIGFALLPRRFTLQQLQGLYEAIYEKNFDKRNFIRKIRSLARAGSGGVQRIAPLPRRKQ